MRHVDEGTIHALIDRELSAAEAEAVRGHLAGCTECTRMLDEARLFQEESDQLLAALEPPGGESGADAGAASPRGPAADLPFIMMPDPDPDAVAPPTLEPVILLPPEPEIPRWTPPRRGRPWLMAASVALLAGGAGYVFALRGGDAAPPTAGLPAVASFDAPASAAELGAPVEPARTDDGAPTVAADAAPRAEPPQVAAKAPPPPAEPEPKPEPAAKAAEPALPAQPAAQTLASAGAAREEADAGAEANAEAADEADRPSSAEERVRRLEEGRRATQEIAARQATETASRRARLAAAARRAPQRETAAAAPAPPAAPPPVSAAERRWGITTRLGLDEVRGILGGPMHVILDMRPMVTGMVEPGSVSGAARDRAVVRVVYIDPAQRVITLDQQRRPGGGAREPQVSVDGERRNARWVVGDVWLSLSASMPEADFQALVRRVR